VRRVQNHGSDVRAADVKIEIRVVHGHMLEVRGQSLVAMEQEFGGNENH
jgi:hypothetical protein